MTLAQFTSTTLDQTKFQSLTKSYQQRAQHRVASHLNTFQRRLCQNGRQWSESAEQHVCFFCEAICCLSLFNMEGELIRWDDNGGADYRNLYKWPQEKLFLASGEYKGKGHIGNRGQLTYWSNDFFWLIDDILIYVAWYTWTSPSFLNSKITLIYCVYIYFFLILVG